MLSSIDKSLHGAETGDLSKAELREALEAFFLVGQPGGKTLNRMEEIMQASPSSLASRGTATSHTRMDLGAES